VKSRNGEMATVHFAVAIRGSRSGVLGAGDGGGWSIESPFQPQRILAYDSVAVDTTFHALPLRPSEAVSAGGH